MRRRFLLTVFLALLVASMGALPALAGNDVNLQVNGDQVKSFEVLTQNGTSMLSAEAFARFAGADLEQPTANTVQVTEQGKTMEFTVGNSQAVSKELLGSEPVALPCAPIASDGKIFIPLRSVSQAFGFNVVWDNAQKTIFLTRSETREGMTASDLLVKSNQLMQDINTYSMEGAMDINMKIAADGKEVEEVPQNMKMEIAGQIQNDPMQIYMHQIIAPIANEAEEEMAIETYMTQDKIYIKTPGQGWVVQDMPFPAEFWKEQQDIQSDPIKAVEQMKEMGMLLNFGNDVQINGQNYYVVNSTLDMDKFQQGYQQIMEQAIQSMQQVDGVDPAQMQQLTQQLINNMQFDYFYTAYINTNTLFTDLIKLDAQMNLTINDPEMLAGIEPQEDTPDVPKVIEMEYDMQGEFKISGAGESFAAPDVSDAQDAQALQDQQVEIPQPADE